MRKLVSSFINAIRGENATTSKSSDGNRTKRVNEGLTKHDIENYQGYLQILNEKVWKKLTPHDLYSLRGISQDRLYKLILKELGIKEKSLSDPKKEKIPQMEEALKQLHIIYNHSINELENTFLLPIPKVKKNIKWSSIRAFSDDIYDTLNDPRCWYTTIVQCALLKTMYAVNDILHHHGDMQSITQETLAVVDTIKKMPGFTVSKEHMHSHDIYFTNGLSKKDPNYVEGRLNFRAKQFKSILMKLIYNRPYMTSEIVKDLIGVRIEIDDPQGTNMWDRALKYFADNLFEKCEMEQKGRFLSSEFVSDIPSRIPKNPKEWTGDLTEVKLVGTVKKINNNSTSMISNDIEVQFVYTGNKNESGFNKHEIYDLKKVLSAVCRLMWGLTVGNIKVAVRQTLRLLKEDDKKTRNKTLNSLNEQSLLIHLLYSKNEHGFLIPVRIDGKLRFFTKDIYAESLHALYKDYPRPTKLDEEEFKRLYEAAKVRAL